MLSSSFTFTTVHSLHAPVAHRTDHVRPTSHISLSFLFMPSTSVYYVNYIYLPAFCPRHWIDFNPTYLFQFEFILNHLGGAISSLIYSRQNIFTLSLWYFYLLKRINITYRTKSNLLSNIIFFSWSDDKNLIFQLNRLNSTNTPVSSII